MVQLMPIMAYHYTFNAIGFSSKTLNDNGEWNDWSEWQQSSATISLDTDKEKLVIDASKKFSYDIYDKKISTNSDREGSNILEYSCVDNDGLKCAFRLRNSLDGSIQIYLDYSDVSFVYQVETQSDMYTLFPNYYAPVQNNSSVLSENVPHNQDEFLIAISGLDDQCLKLQDQYNNLLMMMYEEYSKRYKDFITNEHSLSQGARDEQVDMLNSMYSRLMTTKNTATSDIIERCNLK